MSILINGSPSKPFKMERGLRQGDPLSLFLFVLVVDVLHRMIGEAVRNKCILPLLIGKDNIELSHLQFADDTILFYPPEEETIRNYAMLLRFVEMMSGLTINFDKSSLIQINCEQQWSYNMCNLLGCKEASLPVRYLGISLGANPRLVRTWKPVIDKVEEKLNLWKAKVLNKAEWIWNFQWRRELYQWELELVDQLHETLRPIKLAHDKYDRVVWKFDKQGIFSTNSFVQVMQSESLPEEITSYSFTRTIWKGLVPPRVELFIWFTLIRRVNTKERLHRLGIINHGDNICVLCNKNAEYIHHLFLGCEFTWQYGVNGYMTLGYYGLFRVH
ncbi:uncharacterized protein [Arachis hypogaea]|uniref:uncharacterized protein n=1 Tax=Arachis hypogaea TaxID=3818 RepID=UPI003B20C48C